MQLLRASDVANHLSEWPPDAVASVDVETDSRSVYDPGATLAGISLATRGRPPISIPLHMGGQVAEPGVLEPLLRFLTEHRRLLSFFLGMEVPWLGKLTTRRLGWVDDPWVAARLLGQGGGLKELTQQVLGRTSLTLGHFGTVNFTLLSAQHPDVPRYMEGDAVNALDLMEVLRPAVYNEGLRYVYQDEVAVAVAMAEGWRDGAAVDSAKLNAHLQSLQDAAASHERRALDVFGGPPFLLGSPSHLAQRMQALGVQSPVLTEAGHPSWGIDALEQLEGAHPVIAPLLEWRVAMAEIAALRKLAGSSQMGAYPMWWTLTETGAPVMRASNPSLTTLGKPARQFFPAEFRRRWVHLQWPAEAELWWMLGAFAPTDVAEGLESWPSACRDVGVSPDAMAQIATAWVLQGGGVEPPQVSGVPPEQVSLVTGVLVAWLSPAVERARAALASHLSAGKDAALVAGVHTRDIPLVAGASAEKTWRSFLRTLASWNRWAAVKKQLILAHDAGAGAHWIPNAGTLSFTTRWSAQEVADLFTPYVFPHRPPVAQEVGVGATWGEASGL